MPAQSVLIGTARTHFLRMLRATCSVKQAAQSVGIARSTAYLARDQDPEFAQAWDDHLNEGLDLLEAEVMRRAFEGYWKPVYAGRDLAGMVWGYSDRLAMFMLRALRPEKYATVYEIKITAPHQVIIHGDA